LSLTFKKEERLCSKKAFEGLIASGTSVFCFPFKIIWMKTEFPLSQSAQIAFSVPKRRFKKAHDRNLLKRRIREAYRLNKPKFYQFLKENELRIQLLVVYIAPQVLTYHEIESKTKTALDNLMAAIEKPTK
jgi:ribonuclease P protein component